MLGTACSFSTMSIDENGAGPLRNEKRVDDVLLFRPSDKAASSLRERTPSSYNLLFCIISFDVVESFGGADGSECG